MCDHLLGGLPCDREDEHPGNGMGCTHTSSSFVDDKHGEQGHG